ncbi:MAG: PHP domain-containing protein, partial [Candidatus Marinimicrobia bacterium]|nr:PHP domain-containing protein [Candidatus Neomarinimicrobiota bacterium]
MVFFNFKFPIYNLHFAIQRGGSKVLTHLNVHSNYSAMRGTASQQELLTAARNQGMQYLALTEVNGLWGFIRFVQHAHAAGIKPIAGANIIVGES